MISNFDRLQALIDKNMPVSQVATDVFEKIKQERIQKKQEQLAVVIRRALEIQEQFDKVKREFKKTEQRFEKELGNLLKTIERAEKGTPEPEQDEQQEKNEDV